MLALARTVTAARVCRGHTAIYFSLSVSCASADVMGLCALVSIHGAQRNIVVRSCGVEAKDGRALGVDRGDAARETKHRVLSGDSRRKCCMFESFEINPHQPLVHIDVPLPFKPVQPRPDTPPLESARRRVVFTGSLCRLHPCKEPAVAPSRIWRLKNRQLCFVHVLPGTSRAHHEHPVTQSSAIRAHVRCVKCEASAPHGPCIL